MSYAQQHRRRTEVHLYDQGQQPTRRGYSAARVVLQNSGTPVRLQDVVLGTPARSPPPSSPQNQHQPQQQQQQQRTPLAHPENGARRSNSPQQRSSASAGHAGDAHEPASYGAGVGVSWSEAGSSVGPGAVGEVRQPFHLLQHAPTHAAPPRLKASRKHFASPHASITDSGAAEAPSPVSPPPPAAARVLQDSLATKLRGHRSPSAGERDEAVEEDDRSSAAKAPAPAPVAETTPSSAASSARLSSSPWPASEAFTVRLRNIIETRQQIEALVRKQRRDEEEMVQAIASLDDAAAAAARETPHRRAEAVDRAAYEQLLVERTAAFAALRQFKEKGNVIVHRLYATVKAQQEQQLELIATVEALTKANKRLKDAVGGEGSATAPSTAATVKAEGSGVSDLPDTVPELQQKVATQRRVIEQMDQLMQNADRMLLAMRARVEAAERRGSRGAQERRSLPPLPLIPSAGASASNSPRSTTGHSNGGPAVATPDAVAAIDRLTDRYASDADVATVATQQQLLLERIAELRHALKQEQAQRLHLEEVYGATSEETARNVALLEERLQRAQGARGGGGGGGSAATTAAVPAELHAQLNDTKGSSAAAVASAADRDAASTPEAKARRAAKDAHTASRSSSPASTTASSNPSRNLFTAVSVGDGATQTVQAAAAAGESDEDEDVDVDDVEAQVPRQSAAAASIGETTAGGGAAVDSSPLPRNTSATGAAAQPQQPRAYLGRSRSGTHESSGNAAGLKAKLGIPVPDPVNLGGSSFRSGASRSSSASRRLVDFRPATTADATSRGLGSPTDNDNDSDMDEEAGAPARGRPAAPSSTPLRPTTATTPIVPTAIHSPSSPLPDASTTVNRSAARQQRLQQQVEDLEKMEAEMAA